MEARRAAQLQRPAALHRAADDLVRSRKLPGLCVLRELADVGEQPLPGLGPKTATDFHSKRRQAVPGVAAVFLTLGASRSLPSPARRGPHGSVVARGRVADRHVHPPVAVGLPVLH